MAKKRNNTLTTVESFDPETLPAFDELPPELPLPPAQPTSPFTGTAGPLPGIEVITGKPRSELEAELNSLQAQLARLEQENEGLKQELAGLTAERERRIILERENAVLEKEAVRAEKLAKALKQAQEKVAAAIQQQLDYDALLAGEREARLNALTRVAQAEAKVTRMEHEMGKLRMASAASKSLWQRLFGN